MGRYKENFLKALFVEVYWKKVTKQVRMSLMKAATGRRTAGPVAQIYPLEG